jgi:hypothetical protein
MMAMSTNNTNGGGGLLEDVVPLLVRCPCTYQHHQLHGITTTGSPSPSSVSAWNYMIDMEAILSNIF